MPNTYYFPSTIYYLLPGTASRTVAATQMNATSSRAHTVMCISIRQIRTEDGIKKELTSDMNLVDLAGSERAESTGATGNHIAIT